jgi:alkylation response protein AidB-like acyl-CoA dehydrogenase
MHLGLTDDQSTIKEVFEAFFTKESPTTAARAAEPLGFDRALWDRLLETGAPGMAVPEANGGGGASLGDLVVVAEEYGKAIAPVPLIEHQIAARLLAAAGATELLADGVVDGTTIATIALHPAVSGTWRLVPAGAIADVVVGLDGDDLVAVSSSPPNDGPRNHGAMPLANRSTTDGTRTVLATGPAAQALASRALSEWKTITASALIGIAQRSLTIALEYVMARHQFGRPIGSFQAVQHGLADLPIQIDGGRLLAHKAAWAGDGGDTGVIEVGDNDVTDFGALASMAIVFNGDAAAHATDRSLHFHGGYGFAEEYDIQLFYRRARGWALVLDDPGRECLRLADTLFGPATTGGH